MVRKPGLYNEDPLAYKTAQQMVVQSIHLCLENAYPRRVTWIRTKEVGDVNSGCSGALKPGWHGLSCNAPTLEGWTTLNSIPLTRHRCK